VTRATTYGAPSRKYRSGYRGGDGKLVGGGEVENLELLDELRHGDRRSVQQRLPFRNSDVEIARSSGPNGINCNLKCVDSSQRARTLTVQASTVGIELVLEVEEPAREIAYVRSEGVLEAVEDTPILDTEAAEIEGKWGLLCRRIKRG
jgi:hypothetical protein